MKLPRLYWSYATRSLMRGGQRTLLAIFCVAVGVMAIVSLQLVGNMVNLGPDEQRARRSTAATSP